MTRDHQHKRDPNVVAAEIAPESIASNPLDRSDLVAASICILASFANFAFGIMAMPYEARVGAILLVIGALGFVHAYRLWKRAHSVRGNGRHAVDI